jgi:ADP-ribosylglycohydrolase
LLTLQEHPDISIREAAKLIGCSGHAPESVPFAIFAAQKARTKDSLEILTEIISCGGDTDTNASLAGQIIGAITGYSRLPSAILSLFDTIAERDFILNISENLSLCRPGREI